MTSPVQKAIEAALSAVARRETLTEIFFVACGGSFAQMHLPKYAMDREARTVVADTYSTHRRAGQDAHARRRDDQLPHDR